MQVLDIGVFAHNEGKRIGPFLKSLSRQSVSGGILMSGCISWQTAAQTTRWRW